MTKMEVVKVGDNSRSFTEYSPYSWAKIALMNACGLDKENFPTRISTFDRYESELEKYIDTADEPYQYISHLNNIRKIQAGKPVGMRVALDATNSGTQIIAALMGCTKTADTVGMVFPNIRRDCYTIIQDRMNSYDGISVYVARGDLKDVIMPWNYGSDKMPKDVFGNDTPEYEAYLDACWDEIPACVIYREALKDAWQGNVLAHEFQRPDGHWVKMPVMASRKYMIQVEGMGSFTHIVEENVTKEKGKEGTKALAGRVAHAFDSMIVAEIVRRCNYDPKEVEGIHREAMAGKGGMEVKQFMGTNMMGTQHNLDTQGQRIVERTAKMLSYQPFEVLSTHDEFSCLPSKMNIVRYWYKEILAELAESKALEDVFEQITGRIPLIGKDKELAATIRNSNYCLT